MAAVLEPSADLVPSDALVLFNERACLDLRAFGEDESGHVLAADLQRVDKVVVVARGRLLVEENAQCVDAAALDGVVAQVHAVDAEVLER